METGIVPSKREKPRPDMDIRTENFRFYNELYACPHGSSEGPPEGSGFMRKREAGLRPPPLHVPHDMARSLCRRTGCVRESAGCCRSELVGFANGVQCRFFGPCASSGHGNVMNGPGPWLDAGAFGCIGNASDILIVETNNPTFSAGIIYGTLFGSCPHRVSLRAKTLSDQTPPMVLCGCLPRDAGGIGENAGKCVSLLCRFVQVKKTEAALPALFWAEEVIRLHESLGPATAMAPNQ